MLFQDISEWKPSFTSHCVETLN